MRSTSYLKALLLMGLLAAFALILTGCDPEKMTVHDNEISSSGLILEDFLPENTMMVFSINTNDKSQRQKLMKLKSLFPQDDMNEFMKELIEEMSAELETADMSLYDDIMPIIGDNFRLVIGMAGNVEQDDPEMYIAITVANTDKALELMKKIAEEPGINKGDMFGYPTLTNELEETYIVLYKDTLLVTNKEINRREAVKRVKENRASLLSNETYKKTMKDLPNPNLGTMYIGIGDLFKMLESIEDEDVRTEVNMDIVEALNAEGFAFVAQDDGIEMIVNVSFNSGSEKFNFDDIPYEKPYMHRNLPGKDLIMYSEAFGLSEVYDLEKEILITNEDDQEDFDRILRIIKSFIGLDVEEDIVSWMDKGFAFVMQRNGGIVPGISIYVDTSSSPEKANELIAVIDAAIMKLVEDAKLNAEEGLPVDEMLKIETVNLGGADVKRLVLDFTVMPEEDLEAEGIPPEVFESPMAFYYGLTGDNYLVLSTYADLADEYGTNDTVSNNKSVVEAQTYISGYPYSLTYISIDETMLYVDEFISLMEKVEGPMDDEFTEGYAKVKQYLAPIKYLVSASKKEENVAEGSMFIRMAEVVEDVSEPEEVAEETEVAE